jgi:trk system potassium uptake protein TrkA
MHRFIREIGMNSHSKVTIIGLTTFGEELARSLARAGAEVTVLDLNEAAIQAISDHVADARVVDARDGETLREIGIDRSDLVVVAVRSHFEMSVLIVHTLQQLEVSRIIALAAGKDQARVLEKLGVSRVVFPERDIAAREAQIILNPSLRGYIELAEGYGMVEIAPPGVWVGQSLASLDIRKNYQVNVVAVRDTTAARSRPFAPDPSYRFEADDRLMIIGPVDKIRSLAKETV